ncbi:hypothetical protein [Nostoc sp. UCD121]|uniref:hypothetical protein n=1 Tax=Nostoc sp. UCD121 TaxID=2681305 RepID=UPI001624F040|nr:hypothetical protein [Nostoc sp. UCD121]MBC1224767.1 hypothetical protein [Nostoc sp. UCD120]
MLIPLIDVSVGHSSSLMPVGLSIRLIRYSNAKIVIHCRCDRSTQRTYLISDKVENKVTPSEVG